MFTDLRQTNVGRTLVGGLIACRSMQRTPAVVTSMYLHIVNGSIVRQTTVIGIIESLIITTQEKKRKTAKAIKS